MSAVLMCPWMARGIRTGRRSVTLQHETDRIDCWCQPRVTQLCPEPGCFEDTGTEDPDCWRCGGEGVVEPYDDDKPRLIVHADC